MLRLLSTDFDGTLAASTGAARRCPPAFARALERHAARGGLWAINTGRTLEHILAGLDEFAAPVMPDFLLTNERHIYRHVAGRWEDHGEWNARCEVAHADLFDLSREHFATIGEIARRIDGVSLITENGLPAGLVTSTEEVMANVVNELESATTPHPDFSYQRNTVYLRFCHREYHKGSALAELCRLEEIPREDVFAAGDHYNDLSMLDGAAAAMPACPANAIDAVKTCVAAASGYVANAPFARGVAEAIEFFEKNGRDPAHTESRPLNPSKFYAQGLRR